VRRSFQVYFLSQSLVFQGFSLAFTPPRSPHMDKQSKGLSKSKLVTVFGITTFAAYWYTRHHRMSINTPRLPPSIGVQAVPSIKTSRPVINELQATPAIDSPSPTPLDTLVVPQVQMLQATQTPTTPITSVLHYKDMSTLRHYFQQEKIVTRRAKFTKKLKKYKPLFTITPTVYPSPQYTQHTKTMVLTPLSAPPSPLITSLPIPLPSDSIPTLQSLSEDTHDLDNEQITIVIDDRPITNDFPEVPTKLSNRRNYCSTLTYAFLEFLKKHIPSKVKRNSSTPCGHTDHSGDDSTVNVV